MFLLRAAFVGLLATGLAGLAASPAAAVLRLLDFGDPRIEEVRVDFFGLDSSGAPRASINLLTVPEPSSVLLGIASLTTVVGVDRKRRRQR